MKNRIRQIMESKHMTQQVFAQFLGMSPASLSSIFNGRTNPTLNIVEAVKKKIPDINTDWLMFGVGDMYNRGKDGDSPAIAPANQDLFDANSMILDFDTVPSPTPENSPSVVPTSNSVKSTRQIQAKEEIKTIDKPQRKVVEIRVFYDDQTWESFSPSKK
jgi:transcriptional regulator with XRE-family HTH domain